MDRVAKLKTPEECVAFEENARERDRPDLAAAARRRGIELRAKQCGADTEAELECLQAVYAYEGVLSAKNGKKTRASRTWQSIERHTIIGAVERAVNRPSETSGYTALLEMGLEDFAFEAVVVRYPHLFSAEAVARSKARISEWKRNP